MKSHCILLRLSLLQLTLLNEIFLKSEYDQEMPEIQYSKTTTLKKYRKWLFRTNYRLMQVISIAECSKGSILQYFRPSLSYQSSFRPLFCLFLSGRFTVYRLTHGTMKKRHRTKTPTRQQEHNTIKTNSSLFLSKMIAKLERKLRTISQHKVLIYNGAATNDESTTTTEPSPQNERYPA